MNTDGNKWHYLSITNLSALLEENFSNHHGDFYCLNCFNSYATKNKLEEHEEICNNHDSYRIEMPKFAKRIIKYAHGVKSLRAPFAIYLDLECLLKKEQSYQNNLEQPCQSNLEKSYTEKKAWQCLQNVHLTKQKINSIITEEGIVLKNCVKC